MSPTKEEIRDILAIKQADYERLLEELEPHDYDRLLGKGRWTIRQVLIHIAQSESVHLMLARFARRRLSIRMPRAWVPYFIPAWNEVKQFADRRITLDQMLEKQRKGRAALLRFLDECSDADLRRRCFQFHDLQWSTIGDYLIHNAYHQAGHVADIREALADPSPHHPDLPVSPS